MLWESWYLKHSPFLQVTFFMLNWKLRGLLVRVIISSNIKWDMSQIFRRWRVTSLNPFPVHFPRFTRPFRVNLCHYISQVRVTIYICAFLLTLTEYRLHSPLNHQSDCSPSPMDKINSRLWTTLTGTCRCPTKSFLGSDMITGQVKYQ